jgi:saccharopine dehydrogenase (NAD+, L-lysine-forming)
MLYGAYGSTGRLILDEALRRGHRPVLAGRDSAQLSALGRATGLRTLPLPLDDGAPLRVALSRVSAVLLAAGPYQWTGAPMRAACLDVGCSYLDVNGEIDDFNAALACDAQARAAGIAIIAGVGYGVVFAECLAAQLALRLPDATWLRLSLATQTGARSRGAQLSTAATIAAGGREIYQGSLRKRALAFSTWCAPGADAPRMRFAAAPLAELLAVQRSTGIPNIVAGIPLSRPTAALMRIAGPLLGKLLTRKATRASNAAVTSPPAAAIVALRSRVWAEAGNATGACVAAMLETGEGYHAAAAAAVRALELQLQEPRVGALTPVQAFGARFPLLVPGTSIQEL